MCSLFAAPKIDGVLAKMNQLYLQTTEQHNFMKVLRQLLGLDVTAGVNACLKRLTHLLDEVRLFITQRQGMQQRGQSDVWSPHLPPACAMRRRPRHLTCARSM